MLDLLGLTPHDLNFFQFPLGEWNNSLAYKILKDFVTGLTVVNDTAERFIKIVKDKIGTVKVEKRLLDTCYCSLWRRMLAEKCKRRTIS